MLSGPWAALVRAHAEDRRRARPLLGLLGSRSIPLSERSTGAFADLVERMVALHPERFGYDALRRRRNHWACQAALALLSCLLDATWLPKGSPLAGDVVLTLFLLGCGFLAATATLWRAASAVKKLLARREWKGSPLRPI